MLLHAMTHRRVPALERTASGAACRWGLIAWALVTAACGHERQTPARSSTVRQPPDRGSPALITTVSHATPSYEVIASCREPGVGVIGRGRVRPPDPEEVGEAGFNTWTVALGDHLDAELGALSAGVGWGIGCDGRSVGPRVYVHHYGMVDDAVHTVAALLEREELGVAVFIIIAPDMVPL